MNDKLMVDEVVRKIYEEDLRLRVGVRFSGVWGLAAGLGWVLDLGEFGVVLDVGEFGV